MTKHITRLVIDSRDRVSGTRNSAKFQIPWSTFTKWDNIQKIEVRAQFTTCGGYYSTTTPPAGGGTTNDATNTRSGQQTFNSTCTVCMNFNTGVETIVSGQNARSDFLLTAYRNIADSSAYYYESNQPILELRSPPQGLTEITLIRNADNGPLVRTVTIAGVDSNLGTAYLANDSSDWILVLFLEVFDKPPPSRF